MSTYYRPDTTITLDNIAKVNSAIFQELEDDSLKSSQSYIFVVLRKDNSNLFYRDKNFLHFDMNKEGNIIDVRRYGSNDDNQILMFNQRVPLGTDVDFNGPLDESCSVVLASKVLSVASD